MKQLLVCDLHPREEDFRLLGINGRSSYVRNYEMYQLQGADYIRVRYLNTRKEPGNWSQPFKVIVS